MRRMAVAACTLAVAFGLSGCSIGRHTEAIPKGAAVVKISHMAFQPPIVEVKVGQPVVWEFDDAGVVHDVVGLSGPVPTKFRSPNKESGDWVHAFTAPGIYRYYCSLHTYMHGEVIVDS